MYFFNEFFFYLNCLIEVLIDFSCIKRRLGEIYHLQLNDYFFYNGNLVYY